MKKGNLNSILLNDLQLVTLRKFYVNPSITVRALFPYLFKATLLQASHIHITNPSWRRIFCHQKKLLFWHLIVVVDYKHFIFLFCLIIIRKLSNGLNEEEILREKLTIFFSLFRLIELFLSLYVPLDYYYIAIARFYLNWTIDSEILWWRWKWKICRHRGKLFYYSEYCDKNKNVD